MSEVFRGNWAKISFQKYQLFDSYSSSILTSALVQTVQTFFTNSNVTQSSCAVNYKGNKTTVSA